MRETSRESEDCLLARHPSCDGRVVLSSSANVVIKGCCECECHRPR